MEKQGSRALLAAVIGMGVLLFLGSLALVGVLVHRMMHPAPPPAATMAVAGPVVAGPDMPAQAALVVDEPPGTAVRSVTARADGLLAVALTGGGVAERIIVWDPAARRITARLVLGQP
ncbi:hypothetical protein LV564_11195 [Komagataeibacter nataicola]|uniref:Uncharacterized protein n=2 Tax=Komagataeibacter nataicola TaxID=265960 RepID=A0ABX5P9U9_9PROT|nr:hypothetical protein [Komagataeibacter nataicola]PYD66031.1 hypothetical protein CDI09_10550 [Komagataeibacter nataicola]WEQ54736.1 hypothetical protein LV564_11195 [Komagataeibacter nataicola]GBR20188.1 hypothetical protein AA0616_1730 [Komagataeibacter nataicola NRIC 0616]